MGLDINNVAKALGISEKSAKALDALDGKSDKQVQQSIYDEAAKLLNAARTSKGDSSIFNFEFKEEVYNAIEEDITSIMGYVRNNKEQEYNPKMNDTWAGIVQTFYPDLLESCNGKMFGENGAVRKLQEALCSDKTGQVDTAKLKDMMRAADLPKAIRFPDEINGTKVNKDLVNESSGNANGILSKEEVLGGMVSELRKEE